MPGPVAPAVVMPVLFGGGQGCGDFCGDFPAGYLAPPAVGCELSRILRGAVPVRVPAVRLTAFGSVNGGSNPPGPI